MTFKTLYHIQIMKYSFHEILCSPFVQCARNLLIFTTTKKCNLRKKNLTHSTIIRSNSVFINFYFSSLRTSMLQYTLHRRTELLEWVTTSQFPSSTRLRIHRHTRLELSHHHLILINMTTILFSLFVSLSNFDCYLL